MPTNTLTPPETRIGTRPDRASRMDWLDALRGLAALVVVFEHTLDVLLPEVRETASPWFDFGRYGVFVFFLVSGYVVPSSLERHGSVERFWVGRAFRLYPAWAVSAVLALLLGMAGLSYGLPAALGERPWASTLAHLTMMQDLLGVPNALNVYWTLSYEMVFYLLVTAMFVAGVHRSGARVALGFGVGAAILGVALPSGLLASRWPGGTILVAALSLVGGLAAMASPRRGVRRSGVAVVAALALGLLVLNSRIGAIESLCVIATMFAGTAIRGVHDGRLRVRPAVATIAVVAVFTLVAGLRAPTSWALHANPNPLGVDWSVAVGAAWLTFLAALLLRDRPMPRALVWSGLVSYSLYLLHPLVIQVVWHAAGREPGTLPGFVRLAWGVLLVTVVLGCAAFTYRYVELPAQRAGRRLTARPRRGSLRAAGWRPRTATASPPRR
ncbi:peptidoglycan/LPS O-acetylase OafA/YrhL [Actinomadura pelletieri DSM 43383]|uniref:Peptidoglycan/LPS O-acetylase OafA/YrhL n=1 Tax=Actinomadura pelletieri DSM 43383 TaxID=1120940 RepID=A0A495QMA6_9ACTN|nr:acyltransferase [Actinomadura pelletieri]RKS73709.1 peptidoglycan/LPS O-acetylase OafA/YrhL [Actinomadura pelletieri DSM 43383]